MSSIFSVFVFPFPCHFIRFMQWEKSGKSLNRALATVSLIKPVEFVNRGFLHPGLLGNVALR